MEEIENYKIIESQLGRNKHSKVYLIEEKNTRQKLIVKIYDDSQIKHYKNEKNILDYLNQILPAQQDTRFFNMYINIQYNPNMFDIPEEVIGNNLEFLFYDYLPKLSLLHYIIGYKEKIKEIHAKYIAYKILKSLDQMHLINFCHNSLKSYNIMFDDDFNLKFIHFCKGEIIINDTAVLKLNKDIFDLGQILAQIISQGKFKSICYNEKNDTYEIFTFSKKNGKYEHMEESKFWNLLQLNNVNIPNEFLKLFRVLIYSIKSKALTNIESLLDNDWLKEIKNDIPKFQEIFINDFNNLYKAIIEDEFTLDEITIEIDNIIDDYENEVYTDQNESGRKVEENINSSIKEDNNKGDSYEQNLDKINNNLNKLNINEYNFYKPRKGESNYLKINVENKKNKDIISAMKYFMINLKFSLKEYYDDADIKVNFEEIKDFSFKIKYEIPPMNFDNEKIEFLDKEFEQKIKNVQKFEIKVELIEGNKNLFETKKINQYYLIFNGDSLDKEDFYDHIQIIKEYAKSLLINE